jgi:hypothetical protein
LPEAPSSLRKGYSQVLRAPSAITTAYKFQVTGVALSIFARDTLPAQTVPSDGQRYYIFRELVLANIQYQYLQSSNHIFGFPFINYDPFHLLPANAAPVETWCPSRTR